MSWDPRPRDTSGISRQRGERCGEPVGRAKDVQIVQKVFFFFSASQQKTIVKYLHEAAGLAEMWKQIEERRNNKQVRGMRLIN